MTTTPTPVERADGSHPMSGERIETAGEAREQIARALGLVDGAVSVPLSGRYGRYADALAPLIAEAEERGAQATLAEVAALASEYEADDAMHLAAFGQHHPVAYSAGRHLRDLLGERPGVDR